MSYCASLKGSENAVRRETRSLGRWLERGEAVAGRGNAPPPAAPRLASLPFRLGLIERIAEAQAPFWRHVREALAERHP